MLKLLLNLKKFSNPFKTLIGGFHTGLIAFNNQGVFDYLVIKDMR